MIIFVKRAFGQVFMFKRSGGFQRLAPAEILLEDLALACSGLGHYKKGIEYFEQAGAVLGAIEDGYAVP